MTAAIALTKTLTATATLGRISSAYPNGRRYQSVWSGPSIDYPRPTSERSSASGNGLGLHTEWDKWPAGIVWDPRIGVRFGAAPYLVTITNEAVDGVPGPTGVALANYIEDHTSTAPYLRLRHPGVTAPAAGTKVLSFTINAVDCEGVAATPVDVSVTFYASDHADFAANFKWVDPSAATNGTGTFASPIKVLAGADVDGNPTLLGTDWNVATGRASTVMALFKGTGTISCDLMSKPPVASFARGWFTKDASRPRQLICIEGSNITYERNTTGGPIVFWMTDDVTFRGFRLTCASGSTVGKFIDIVGGNRQAIYDLTFEDVQLTGDASADAAPACIGSRSDDSEYVFISHIDGINIDNDASPVNSSGVIGLLENRKVLIDSVTLSGTAATFTPQYSFRFKHSTIDTEVRRCVDLVYSPVHSQRGWSYSSGGGTNDHVRAVFRYNCIFNSTLAFRVQMSVAPDNNECHSIMVHFNTIKGAVLMEAEMQTGVANAAQWHAYGNLLENGNHATNYGWNTLDTDLVLAEGKSALIESSIAGAVGTLVDASGVPLLAANFGQYGHTVIAA